MSTSGSRSELVLAMAEEFLERYRQGQRPSLKEYTDRHPSLADEIREVFPAMAMMERIALADESLAGGPDGGPRGAKAPLEQMGDYRILREIGRGGMGVVYEAEQVSLGRNVALKILPPQIIRDEKHHHRFEREARAAGRLHHTNIVPVFGVGEHDGTPYYVMQFIPGLGLDEVLEELKRMKAGGPPTAEAVREREASSRNVTATDLARSLTTGRFDLGAPGETIEAACDAVGSAASESPRHGEASPNGSGRLADSSSSASLLGDGGGPDVRRARSRRPTYWESLARVGVQVADALEYAHMQGILHRDVKPSNLLLDNRGTVWVTDFGLAKANDQPNLTHTGDILGTLRYMPPEAFSGKFDARSDVYSLGLTLYELLALRPAFGEQDRGRLIRQVTSEEPERLGCLVPEVPRDLETIVHKAIEREPAHRYATAGELAADLQRFLDDEPIRARRATATEQVLRWARRNPGIAVLGGTLAAVLIGVAAVSTAVAGSMSRLARQEASAARLAQNNYQMARLAVDEYLTRVGRSPLLREEGLHDLRQELLEAALHYYQNFLNQRQDSFEARRDAALAYERVGDINRELGRFQEAIDAYDRGLALAGSGPKDPALALAKIRMEASRVANFSPLGRFQEGIDAFEAAAAQAESGPAVGGFDPRPARVRLYNAGAEIYTHAGKTQEGLETSRRAVAVAEEYVSDHPDDLDTLHELMTAYHSVVRRLNIAGRVSDALEFGRRAVERGESALRARPRDLDVRVDLGAALGEVAVVEHFRGRTTSALAASSRSVELLEQTSRDNPLLFGPRRTLVLSLSFLSNIQCDLGRLDDSRRSAGLAVEYAEGILRGSPEFHEAREMLGNALASLGKSLLNAQEVAKAVATLRRAADMLRGSSECVYRYNAACCLSMASGVADPAEGGAAASRRSRDADEAFALLEGAIDCGLTELGMLSTDPDLEPLRKERAEAFQGLLRRAEEMTGDAGRPAPGPPAE